MGMFKSVGLGRTHHNRIRAADYTDLRSAIKDPYR
jgi:hypothetical protein